MLDGKQSQQPDQPTKEGEMPEVIKELWGLKNPETGEWLRHHKHRAFLFAVPTDGEADAERDALEEKNGNINLWIVRIFPPEQTVGEQGKPFAWAVVCKEDSRPVTLTLDRSYADDNAQALGSDYEVRPLYTHLPAGARPSETLYGVWQHIEGLWLDAHTSSLCSGMATVYTTRDSADRVIGEQQFPACYVVRELSTEFPPAGAQWWGLWCKPLDWFCRLSDGSSEYTMAFEDEEQARKHLEDRPGIKAGVEPRPLCQRAESAPAPDLTAAVNGLDLAAFSKINRQRCESPDGFNHKLDSWSLSDWFTAVLGELGEAANVAKKLNRVRDGIPGNKEGTQELLAKLARELADTFIYLDLLAQAAGVDLPSTVVEVFNAKSKEIGSSILMPATPPASTT